MVKDFAEEIKYVCKTSRTTLSALLAILVKKIIDNAIWRLALGKKINNTEFLMK